LDTAYCFEKCKIGKAASCVFLDLNNSVFDAALDFDQFIENCFKYCPYKSVHEKQKN
jgi:hypothetical protein